MLFPNEREIDDVWQKVATHTANGDLGIAAKVEPKPSAGEGTKVERLICIYTYNFRDMDDVKRVLGKLRVTGVVAGRQIWYKTGMCSTSILVPHPFHDQATDKSMNLDAFTYLGISSGNPWGLRASLYGSNDFPVEARRGDWDFS